jgi:hypothetical protein
MSTPTREPLRLSSSLLDYLEALAEERQVTLSHLVESCLWHMLLEQYETLNLALYQQ